MRTITKSTAGHPFNRTYERLRKRSYRHQEQFGHWDGRSTHEAYVQGVKDALNEIAQQARIVTH